MTARATLTQSDLDRAVKAAAKARMSVTVTAPDGKTFTFTPLDAKGESGQHRPVDPAGGNSCDRAFGP
jgi:hypothetical protein